MYGMMPSAKTVARERPPPTNRSYRPRSVAAVRWFLKKSASACDVHPRRGDVRADPVDQQAQEREEDLLLAAPGSIEEFGIARARSRLRLDAARRPPRSCPRRTPRPAAPLTTRPAADVAVAEQLDRPLGAARRARPRRAASAVTSRAGDTRQVLEVHRAAHVDLERVGEAALRHAPVIGIWPPSKPGFGRARPRAPSALVALARRLAVPGARAAAHALAVAVRALGRAQVDSVTRPTSLRSCPPSRLP